MPVPVRTLAFDSAAVDEVSFPDFFAIIYPFFRLVDLNTVFAEIACLEATHLVS
jgi:hypothetical protein